MKAKQKDPLGSLLFVSKVLQCNGFQVKINGNLPYNAGNVAEMHVWSLGQGEVEMALTPAYSCLRDSWAEDPGGYSPWSQKESGHNWATEDISTHDIIDGST